MTVDEVANKTKEEGGRRRRRNRQVESKAQPAATSQARKDRPTPARRESGGSRGNIITRGIRAIVDYFMSTRAELQKVSWPTRQESLRLSGIVIAVTIVSSLALGAVDLLYGELFRIGLSSPVIFVILAVVLVIVVGGSTLMLRRRGGL
jgi:preprotein translocase subunit SecE